MPHDKEYVIRLNGLDLGQLIDALEARANVWYHTATHLESGAAPNGFVIEECSEAREARSIEAHYKRIIRLIEVQRSEQEGSPSNR